MKTLHLHGSHIDMGRQHAAQVRTLLAGILRAIAAREQELAHLKYDYRPVLAEACTFMAAQGKPTWEMLRGIGEGLEIEWELLQRYTLSSYLLDYRHMAESNGGPSFDGGTGAGGNALPEGCTCFAAAPPLTATDTPLLAKNRDYRLDHVDLQTLIFSTPDHGYRYLHLGSAGSTGVFSSGMNECGLAIADTHVVSLDIGPGLPRYALMQEILESCDSTAAACDYLRSIRHMGAGTLVLADRRGHLATCESAYRQPDVRMQAGGWVARTNHFQGEALRQQWLNTEPPAQRGNSEARLAFVGGQLTNAEGVDAGWAQALLATHAEGLHSLCRHPDETTITATILSTVFLPGAGQVWVGRGAPCQAAWTASSLAADELPFRAGTPGC